jgi:RNA polymerase sigma-70 factor (ECF subfamily)
MDRVDLNQLTDEELMVMYQIGSEEAFKILYERHSSKVFGFLQAKVRSQERAHDIFQEIFMKVHKSKHLYNKSLPFLPWLFTVTKNSLIDEVRKSNQRQPHVEVTDVIAAPELALTPSVQDVAPYLRALPENQKRVVELRYVEEKTFIEISAILNTSEVNVRKLLSRGLQRIRELLQEGEKP